MTMKTTELNEFTGEIETHITRECSRCDEPSERFDIINGQVICPCCILPQDVNGHKAALYSQHVTITPTKCKLVEKQNHLAVHGLFDSLESAQKHLEKNIPDYVAKGYFMDKTLTKDSFEII